MNPVTRDAISHVLQYEKVAHAKEENLNMHQMLDQTLQELNNM